MSDGGSFGGTVTVSGAVTLAGGTSPSPTAPPSHRPAAARGRCKWPANLSLAGSLSTTVVAIAGGTLAGTGTLAAGSQATWSGGTLAGAVTNAGTLAISGNEEYLAGTSTNTGTIDVTGSGAIYAYGSNATINNQAGAIFDFQSNGSLGNPYGYPNPTFNNAGTLEMTAGTGTSSVGFTLNNTVGTVNALSGTLELTNSGLVSSGTLGVGTWVVGSGSTLTISGVSSISTLSANVTLQGSGATFTGISSLSEITAAGELELQNEAFTTAGNLDNAGTIDLAPGTLNVDGTYTQESTGAYDVAIGGITPGSSYGQLNVTKSASLNGALSVNLINNYTPPQGDSYQVLTFASETGNFSAEFGLSFGGGGRLQSHVQPQHQPHRARPRGHSRVGGHPDDGPVVGESLELRRYRHLHGHGVADHLHDLVPTGQVTFYDGSTAVDTATLVNGSATYVDATLGVGTYSISVQYGGDSNFSGSNSTVLTPYCRSERQPDRHPIVGEPVRLWRFGHVHGDGFAHSSASGLATPTGQVEFFDGSTLLDTATLSGGTASLRHVDPALGGQSTDRGDISRRLQLRSEQCHDPADREYAASNRLLDGRLGCEWRQRRLEQPRKLVLRRTPNHGGNGLFHGFGIAVLDIDRRHLVLDRQLDHRQHLGRLDRCERLFDHLREPDPGERHTRRQRSHLRRR